MANLPPNHNEFAPAVEAAPNNLHGWIKEEEEEEDLEMEEEEEEMDSEIEFEEAEAEAEAEVDAEVAPIPPPPILVDHEPEAEAATIGSSSSSAAAGHDLEDLTPSYIRSDLDALHRSVRQIENDDVRVENKRLRMMLDCSENRTRATDMSLPQFEGALRVPVTHNDPRDPYVAARDVATAPAIDNDDPATREETSPSEPQGSPPFSRINAIGCNDLIMPPKAMSQAAIERLITQRVNAAVQAERARPVNARGQGSNANEGGG
ncbi:hypothetical protein Tco_1195352 [Tanacetum coccineum]